MAYNKAQREEIALTNGEFQRQVGGCLYTHARYLYDTDHSTRDANEMAIILSVLADPAPFAVSASRAFLQYPSQDSLADVTSVTDNAVLTLIPTLWPMLVSAWRGVVVE